MKYYLTMLFLLIFSSISFAANHSVTVVVVDKKGEPFEEYYQQVRKNQPTITHKYYLEAKKNKEYDIKITNYNNMRVGVVVAIDGRNVINGKQSWLKNNERMYIINSGDTLTIDGWRTGHNHVNSFYFTKPENSYAAAFDDTSAMGVIGVAVYPEMEHIVYDAPQAEMNAFAPNARGRAALSKSDSAGTGYGRQKYSPSSVVEFEPRSYASEKILFKYEWKKTLCDMGIAECGYVKEPKHRNRIWDNEPGYAPAPPRR